MPNDHVHLIRCHGSRLPVFFHDPLPHLVPMDRELGRGFHPQPDLGSLHFKDDDPDLVANLDPFTDLPRQNKNGEPPRPGPLGEKGILGISQDFLRCLRRYGK